MPLSLQQRKRVLDSILAGRLPLEPQHKMYAGQGDGHECAGCCEAIDQSQVEYEATLVDGRTYRLHLGCAALWDAEVRRRPAIIEHSGRVREQSRTIRESARETSKESARLRDHADVLAREAEAAREELKRVRRGQSPSK